jgi:hypothetical protein
MKLSNYCPTTISGWQLLPDYLNPNKNENRIFICDEGIQVTVSIDDWNVVHVLHVSIGQINAFNPDLTPEELHEWALPQHPEILQLFFPERIFMVAPDVPEKPYVHHYFSPLN